MTDMGYVIKENGYYIPKMVHDARGWHKEAKTWKTESAAKAWVTRRMNELGENACKFTFEIKKHW